MNKREPFWDNAKILLMVLVVLGHIFPIDKTGSNLATYNLIFSFHMPLFVFISGYFTKIDEHQKFWRGIGKLAETFIVFTIIHICVLLLQGESFKENWLIVPRWTLWYLVSLICWRLILYYSPPVVLSNSRLVILLAFSLCLILGWIPVGKSFSFHRTFSFLPFFMLGYLSRRWPSWIDRGRIRPLLSIVCFVVIWLMWYVLRFNNTIILQDFGYFHYDSPFGALVFRICYLILASVLSICFLSLIPKKEYKWTHFGRYTLFVYMWHSVILSWRYIIRDSFHIPTSFPFCVCYMVLVLFIIYLMSRITIFHWILNPISWYLSKRKCNKYEKN